MLNRKRCHPARAAQISHDHEYRRRTKASAVRAVLAAHWAFALLLATRQVCAVLLVVGAEVAYATFDSSNSLSISCSEGDSCRDIWARSAGRIASDGKLVRNGSGERTRSGVRDG